jgi:hypothetical protein
MFIEIYMKSLDDIDDENLTRKEVKARQIAKHTSLIWTLLGYYVLIFPILFFIAVLDRNFISTVMIPILKHGVLKPTRWVLYQLIYFPCKLIFQAIG